MITITIIVFVVCLVVSYTGIRARIEAKRLGKRGGIAWTEDDDSVLMSFIVGAIGSGIALLIQLR